MVGLLSPSGFFHTQGKLEALGIVVEAWNNARAGLCSSKMTCVCHWLIALAHLTQPTLKQLRSLFFFFKPGDQPSLGAHMPSQSMPG